MITETLSRRLERLEESMIPLTERKAWQIIIIDSAGNREHGPGYQFPCLPKNGFRPSHRQQKTRGR